MTPVNSLRGLRPLLPASTILRRSVATGLAAWLGITPCVWLILGLDTVPYNIRELAEHGRLLAAGALGAALLAAGAMPLALAALWRRDARAFGLLLFPLLTVVATLAFLVLRMAVPTEALDDIVGSPILGIGATAERWMRFLCLVAGPLAALTLGARLTLGRLEAGAFLSGGWTLLALVALSYVVVVPFRATSNIVELLRGRGDVSAALSLVAYFVAVGWLAAWPHSHIEQWRRARRAAAMWMLVVALSVLPGWLLLVAASNPHLEKYGAAFSARQFLFSPDRDHYLDDRSVFARFGILHAGLIAALAAGAASVPLERRPESLDGENRLDTT